jgi:hypothetical protein
MRTVRAGIALKRLTASMRIDTRRSGHRLANPGTARPGTVKPELRVPLPAWQPPSGAYSRSARVGRRAPVWSSGGV